MAYGFRQRTSHNRVQKFTVGAAVAIGDLVELDGSNYVIPAVTNHTDMVGVVVAPGTYQTDMDALVAGTDTVMVCVDPEAVYAVDDANARKNGAKLDVSGTTGAMTVAAVVNSDLLVVADSTSTQETLVQIARKAHYATA